MPEIFIGDLSQLKLFDILKPLLMGKKTGRLSFKGRENGEIYLELGNIVHAKTHDSSGEYGFFQFTGETGVKDFTKGIVECLVGTLSRLEKELPKDKILPLKLKAGIESSLEQHSEALKRLGVSAIASSIFK
jgi:hypothetical protein